MDKKIIKGSRRVLSEGRSVFVGKVDGEEDYYVECINEGVATVRKRFSPEALQAIMDLRDAGVTEEIVIPPPPVVWVGTQL